MFAMAYLKQADTNSLGWVWFVILGLIVLAVIIWALFRRVNQKNRVNRAKSGENSKERWNTKLRSMIQCKSPRSTEYV